MERKIKNKIKERMNTEHDDDGEENVQVKPHAYVSMLYVHRWVDRI